MSSVSQRPLVSQPLPQLVDNAGLLQKMAMALLCLYLIFIVSRIHEIITVSIGFNLRLSVIPLVLCLVATVGDGGLARLFPSKIAIVFVLLAWWVVLCVPTSIWLGGSVKTIVDFWITSVLSFFVVAAAPRTLRDCRNVIVAMGAAFLLLLVSYAAYGRVLIEGRVGLGVPSLGNPNHFALQLLFALPFCMLLGTTFSFLGLARTFGVFYGLLAVGHTGSRGAFVATALMFLVALYFFSFFRKLLLAGFLAIVAVVVLATSSSLVLDRYRELLATNEEFRTSEAFESAQYSREDRRRYLKESVVLTLKNPVFGVGPGMFQVASSDEKFTGGMRGAWRETHNTLTQFSSECGLLAAFLFLGIAWYCIKTPFSLYRVARRRPELTMLAGMSFCLLLSALGLLVNSMFASVAYQFYYPVLLGITVAVRRTADVEIARLTPLPPKVTPFPASIRKSARPAPRSVGAAVLPRLR